MKDLKFDGQEIYVQRQTLHASRAGQARKVTQTKGKMARSVWMNPILYQDLKDYLAWRDGEGHSNSEWLFVTSHGNHADGVWVWCVLRDAQVWAGQVDPDNPKKGKYSPHCLRHFAGSAWIAMGADIADVSRWLGHKSVEFTRKVYIHQLEGDDRSRRAIEGMMGKFFPGLMPVAALPKPEPVLVEAVDIVDELDGDIGFDGQPVAARVEPKPNGADRNCR